MLANISTNFLLPKSQGGYITHKPPKPVKNVSIKQVIDLRANGSFSLQYNHMYVNRFEKLYKGFTGICPHSIAEINGEGIVSGIIKKKYKKLAKKIGSKKSAMSLQTDDYVEPFVLFGDDDIVEIEDETGKIEIMFNEETRVHNDSNIPGGSQISLKELPFGIVVAIRGYLEPRLGKFICQHVYFPQLQEYPEISNLSIEEEKNESPKQILVMSNMRDQDYQTLIEFYQKANYALKQQKIVLVLCGNLLVSQLQGTEKYRRIDEYLNTLSKYVLNVIVLPDYGGKSWPHKPLPNFFLQSSKNYVVLAHNPTILDIDGCRVLITNGQNITESNRVCSISNPLDIMQSHLVYRHFAPYCPSSFKCTPLTTDSFTLDQLPNMYIVANQSQFDTRLWKNNRDSCRLVTVSSASDAAVLINTKNYIPQTIFDLNEIIQ